MTIGEQLSAMRQARNLSQADVAKALYVTRQTVSRWEQGHTLPNIYVLQDLSALYGCSLDQLIAPSSPVKQKEDEPMHHRINWLGLFGVFWFNLIVGFAAIVVVASLIFSLWVIIGAFIASPVLAALAYVVFGQAEQWWQFAAAALLCLVGAALWRPAVTITQYGWQVFLHYLRYNRRSVIKD